METSPNRLDENSIGDNLEKVLQFGSTMLVKERPTDVLHTDGLNHAKRDWSAALNLVNECFEAIRLADQRATESEEQMAQLAQRLNDQLRASEARTAAALRRAEESEHRAKQAEEWLARFHDTIVEGFQNTFASK